MGKTLYLIKQKVADTADVSDNQTTVLNTVLDAIKDISTTDISNILVNHPSLSTTHTIADYSLGKLLNSDFYSDLFDQQFSAFVSEYQDQTSWTQNDPDYPDGTVSYTYEIGLHPGVGIIPSTSSASPESAPLYDATFFVTTEEQNTADTSDNRFRVQFNEDLSGRYQVFKAINSSTYRQDGTSGLTVAEVGFNANAGLTENYVVRDPSTNELSIDYGSNIGHKLTVDPVQTTFELSYASDFDVSYGMFKVVQQPAAATVLAEHSNLNGSSTTTIDASNLYIADQSGNPLVDSITGDQLIALYSDSIGAGYYILIQNNGGGGYYFDTESQTTSDSNITINDNSLVKNYDYMKTITNNNPDAGSFNSQQLVWTNGTVVPTGTYASNITIGSEGETLGAADYDASGTITFFASDALYSTNGNLQRSAPSNWNTHDTLAVDYATLSSYYKEYQYQELETRVLLPSTYSATLNALGANDPFKQNIPLRYIGNGDNMVFLKSGANNSSIDPASISISTTTYMNDTYSTDLQAIIFEIASSRGFTNQSSLLEEMQLDGSYVEVPGSSVSIIATNVNIPSATDYRFIMNPKKVAGNDTSGFDFPAISGGFSLVAFDGDTYSANHYLNTLKSNLNILGNDIYNIMDNSANVNLSIAYNTNGSATNADSLKNYFDISYSFTVNSSTTTGTHRIEDQERMTIMDLSSTRIDSSYVLLSSGNCNNSTMYGWNLYQIEETSTFSVRTQLYLGAYSNLYIETPTITQVDTRYEVRTATGVVKPDYFLKYINGAETNAIRVLKIGTDAIPVNTVTLSVNDLKSHIGDIQYTTGVADNDVDINWSSIAGPQDTDPNFDSENRFYDGEGTYEVYIDVPKTYELSSPQYIIRMQADAASSGITGYTYDANNQIFTALNYGWDLTTDVLTSYDGDYFSTGTLSSLSMTYVTDASNIVTITAKQGESTLFILTHNGDVVQNLRVIYNPRGLVQTDYLIDGSSDGTWEYFGEYIGGAIRYHPADYGDYSLELQLDYRYRDTYATSSYWSFTNDTATLHRVNSNSDYYDLSYQLVGIDGNPYNLSYGIETGAKSVTFAYYRGNSLGTDSTVIINRTPSTLNYTMTTSNGTSTGGDYGEVYTGFTANTVPSFIIPLTVGSQTINDFGLHVSGTYYSILANGPTVTTYELYMSYDQYEIQESNPQNTYVHNGQTIKYANDFYLANFDGAAPIFTNWVALTIKAPYLDFYQLTNGTTNVSLYYYPEYIGHADDVYDASWSALTQGIYDNELNTISSNVITYLDMGNGIYLNNGAIRLQRTTTAAESFTGYFVCPPPQLKVTGVVITPTASYNASGPTLQTYNPLDNTINNQFYYIDVDQVSLETTYYPFANYVSNTNYFMNNLALYEYGTQKSIKSYRNAQTYSRQVKIQENKFSIYEYSGMFMGDVSGASPLTYVTTDLSNTYLSDLPGSIGTVVFDASNGSYTVNIKQDKSPLTGNTGDRYSYENITLTIGSPFLLYSSFDYYNAETYANRWVPVSTIGNYVMRLEYNVGHATRLSLYGTIFSYQGDKYTVTLKRFRSGFGVDYSNFPREITSVIFYAKEKHTKTITFTRPDISQSVANEGEINRQIAAQLASVSWSDASYSWVQDNAFTPGNIKFELAPSVSHIYQQTSLYDASYTSAGVREILSYVAVTKQEPRNIMFMNLQDSVREQSTIYGNYLPKNITTYNGQYYAIDHDNLNNYYLNISEK